MAVVRKGTKPQLAEQNDSRVFQICDNLQEDYETANSTGWASVEFHDDDSCM